MIPGKSFRDRLLLRHHEEISSLYEQWHYLKSSNLLGWSGLNDLEQRIETHILGQLQFGEEALSFIADRVTEADIGECYGFVRVLARMQAWSILESLIRQIRITNDLQIKAISDALCHESPMLLERGLIHNLLNMDGARVRIAAQTIACHRFDFATELFEALRHHSRDKNVVIDIIHAIGRLKPQDGAEGLLNHLHSRDQDIVNAAITTLTRLGEYDVLTECMAYIGPSDWPGLSLGLFGHKDCLSDSFFSVSSIGCHNTFKASKEQVIATGLIGNIERIPDLITWLEDPELSENAALSLNLITGADLREESNKEVDQDALFDDELTDLKHGKIMPEETFKSSSNRLSQNPFSWSHWWNSNKCFFNPDARFRNGTPYSPLSLLQTMESDSNPDMIRDLAYDELVIRYGIDIPFETRMPVIQQWQAIAEYRQRLKGNPDSFTPGVWYYNGRPMDNEPMNLLKDSPL